MTRMATASGARALAKTLKPVLATRTPPPGAGAWIPGVVMGISGARQYRLYLPPGVRIGEQLPLMVMLHGCGQDAISFAASTRMNRIGLRERFLVLYPEQARLANAQRCWNWFDAASGRSDREAALIMKAIDQVCLMHPVDKSRVAIAGLSAGASMAALVATQYPLRFQAIVMHSGVPPGTAHSAASALSAMSGRRATKVPAPSSNTEKAHLDPEWPPLLVIHGDADTVVSPQNGEAAVQAWADATGASAGRARSVRRGKRYLMHITDFKRKGITVATLVAVDRLAHAWSGGAASKPFSDGKGPDAWRGLSPPGSFGPWCKRCSRRSVPR
jgi:poly(hydroxyalkanoate) depolymerase family esterase